MIFEFFTEDGHFKMDYKDYVQNEELSQKMLSPFRPKLNLGLKQLSFDPDWLQAHKGERDFFEQAKAEFLACPIRFYLPNCAMYDTFEESPQHQFINDDSNDYIAALAGNRQGKTTCMWAKELLVNGFIETDPNWECFTEHGIKRVPFTGPKNILCATYEWTGHRQTFWPKVIRAWTPRDELGDKYHWQFPKVTSGEIIKMEKSESTANLHSLEQTQPYESTAYDDVLWDEQGVEEKVEGAEARMKTTRRRIKGRVITGRHMSAATPHKVPGRPDTGAGTWFHRLYKGEEARGWKYRFYQFDLFKGPPDWIFPEKEKLQFKAELEEAEAVMNMRRVRSLRSRIYGEFEWSGGLVYDEWNPDLHVIDDFEIPSDWCMIRAGDHGRVNQSAWVWMAISPENEWFFCRDFIAANETVETVTEQVIKRSGNKRVESGTTRRGRFIGARYKEIFERERYLYSDMDARSFGKSDQDSTENIGALYRSDGLHTLTPAVGKVTAFGIEILRKALLPDYTKKHPFNGKPGRPRCYVFRSCKNIIRYTAEYRNQEFKDKHKNPSEKPQEKDDHIPDAMRYAVSRMPRYNPARTVRVPTIDEKMVSRRKCWAPEDIDTRSENHGKRAVDRFTGA